MPFQLSIQPVIDAQTSALNTTINAARDNVKADNVTQIGTQTTSITTAITAARDAINANTDTDTTAVTTAVNAARDAVNTNTDTKTGAVTTAVNAKGVVKSVQRGTVSPWQGNISTVNLVNVTIAAVNMSKSVVNLAGHTSFGGNSAASAKLTTATNIEFKGWVGGNSGHLTEVQWEVVEYF